MPLPTADVLAQDPFAHGQKPFGYKVYVANEPAPTVVPDFWGQPIQWKEIAVIIDTIELSYGATPGTMTFRIVDLQTTEIRRLAGLDVSDFDVPKNGQLIRVWHTDSSITGFPTQGHYVFQGVIVSVNDDSNAQGSAYNLRAVSNVARLNDAKVSFTANLLNDPINPTPRFDAAGQVYSRLKTVKELVEDVLNFKDAFNRPSYFTPGQIDWNGLDTDTRCGLFIPPNIQFNNTEKGRAIEEILQAVGNYTFCHIIADDDTEHLRIVELNLNCNRCGDKWDVDFIAPSGPGDPIINTYAFDRQIESDSTEWSTTESANTCRITIAPIRFYTGHYIIPERYEDDAEAGGGENPMQRNCITVDMDTAEQQQNRAFNPDRAFYRFTMPRGTSEDMRTVKQYYVGMPLFPAWNPHEDWLPDLLEITGVKFPTGTTTIKGFSESDYIGAYEWAMQCVADSVARGQFNRAHLNNLRVYDAWHASDPCPACSGGGLVQKVYDNDDNEPTFDYYAVQPSGQTKLAPTDPIPSGARLLTKVNNYIFDPSKFGTDVAPSGLTPLPSSNSYPIPWKNLCPYCRGVGLKPEYHIRNIQSVLFQGRANAVSTPIASGIAGGEIYLDPDRVQTGPETWEQANNRISISQPPILQVEVPLTTDRLVLPAYQHQQKSWQMLLDTREVPATDRQHKFPHPLQFKNLHKFWTASDDANDVNNKIAPDGWGCFVPFTTVTTLAPEHDIDYRMGQIFFRDPLFIPCRKELMTYQRVSRDNYAVDSNGQLVVRGPGRGQITADAKGSPTGYWRPARVWLQCFYTREGLFDTMYVDKDNNTIASQEFQATNPDGQVGTYVGRASIHDGRLAIEIIKKYPTPTEAGGTEFPTGNRVIQMCLDEDTMDLEIYPDDLYKLPVLPTTNMDYHAIEAGKKALNQQFVRGRVFVYTRTTPGEVELEMEGYENVGFLNSTSRPKIYSSSLKDKRPDALQRAVRALEASNDITVSGQMTIVNHTINFHNGLGWVDHPNGRATVRKVTLRYSAGFKTILDLNRERARAGETLPDDKERMNNIDKTLSIFKRTQRTVVAAENRRNNNFPRDPNAYIDGFNAPMEG